MSALYNDNPHLTLAELVELPLTTREHVAYLQARVAKNGADSKSGKRASAEIARLTGKSAPAPEAKPAPKPARKAGPGSRGGDPGNYLRGQLASRAGHAPNSPAWWTVYRSAEAKALAATVKTHAQAKKVLASV